MGTPPKIDMTLHIAKAYERGGYGPEGVWLIVRTPGGETAAIVFPALEAERAIKSLRAGTDSYNRFSNPHEVGEAQVLIDANAVQASTVTVGFDLSSDRALVKFHDKDERQQDILLSRTLLKKLRDDISAQIEILDRKPN